MNTNKECHSPTNPTKTILISSGGAGNAFAAMLALRRNWGDSCKIVTIDINPKHLVTSSLLSDKYYQFPETTNSEFNNALEKVIFEETVDTYIPLLDEEIFKAALLYETGRLRENLKIQVTSSEIADLCNDKFKTFLWLSEMNILTPKCFRTNENLPENVSLILKPRKGYGSQVKLFSDISGQISQYNTENYIVQEECLLPEITVDVCYDKQRNFFSCICRERIEVKSGVCTKARLHYDTKLENVALTIADKLSLNSFCFQVMKYKGDWAVTDINARLGAGTAMSGAAGLDFFSGMFAILWGEDPSVYFNPLQKETFVTRQYTDFLMVL